MDSSEDYTNPNSDGSDNQISELENKIADLESSAQANLAGWQRTQADFENYKKRKEQENQELIEFAREVTVAKLLPTLDSLQQGLKLSPNSEEDSANFLQKYQTWLTGINGTLLQLDKALEELGVKKISALGAKFDPHKHESVREVPGEEDGVVVEEYQQGYELNGKIIRPSQVVISKKI